MHTTLELRTPRLLNSLTQVQDLRLLAFFDAAKLWSLDAGTKSPFVAGAGFGVRFKALKNFNTDVDFAVPLHSGESTKDGDFRSHVRLWYEF